MTRVGVAGYDRHLQDLSRRLAGHAARPETRARIPTLVGAFAADLPGKNAWTLAEHTGEDDPHGVQHFLNRAAWDEAAGGAELRSFVAEHLGHPDGVLVVDETGDLKKGTRTVGVQRQYTGTAGRTENAQVGVYLGYATRRGHALVDREVYLPASWTDDPARCAEAGVPEHVGFATEPTLAGDMIESALGAGVPARWVAGDEVYGGDPKLARRIEALSDARITTGLPGVGYVLAISCRRQLPIDARTSRSTTRIAADLPRRAWQRRSAGAGAHGHREYEWAYVSLHPRVATRPNSAPREGGQDGKPVHSPAWARAVSAAAEHARATGKCWWLLIRRHPRTKAMAFYLCFAPAPVPLGELVAVAGRRWTIEESFQATKGLTGLDQHQVRRWTSWRRWTLLAMAAHAVLAVTTATARAVDAGRSEREGLIPLTCAEIRRLIFAAARRVADHSFVAAWSYWRRRHQQRAKVAHYARRERQSKIK